MALPDLKRSMIRITTVPVEPGTNVNWYAHATKSAAATVLAAGYFNFFRATAKVGDLVTVVCGIGGTVETLNLKFATVPASGDVTVNSASGVAQLTDNSTGTSGGDTIGAVTDTATAANAIATLAAKVNAIIGG